MLKKIMSLFLCCMIMVVFNTTVFAQESSCSVMNDSKSQSNDSDAMNSEKATGVTRLKTLGITIYPLVRSENKVTIYQDNNVKFYAKPKDFQTYLREDVTQEYQDKVANYLKSEGLEQVGWYMDTGYYIDSYNPIRFDYYEWNSSGKSSLKTRRAVNGNNKFEFYYYFEKGTEPMFGMTGNALYQSSAGWPTTTMGIELSVTFK